MKKIQLIGLAIVAVFIGNTASAQSSKIGIKAGSNIAGTHSQPDELTGTPVFRPMAGIFYRVNLSDRVQLQPEVLLSYEGVYVDLNASGEGLPNGTVIPTTTSSTNLTTINQTSKNEFTYIRVPVMVRVLLAERFAFEFGPQVGYLLAAKVKDEVTNINTSVSGFGTISDTTTEVSEKDIKDDIEEIDVSMSAGFGYELKNGFGLNARAIYGARGITKENNAQTAAIFDTRSAKNLSFQIGVTYAFNLKG